MLGGVDGASSAVTVELVLTLHSGSGTTLARLEGGDSGWVSSVWVRVASTVSTSMIVWVSFLSSDRWASQSSAESGEVGNVSAGRSVVAGGMAPPTEHFAKHLLKSLAAVKACK